MCAQLTYYEFAKEELEQLDSGVAGTGTASTSFTSSSSDTQDSSQPTGQTTPQDREEHLHDAEEEDSAYQHQQQHDVVEGVGGGEGVPSGARHYSVHRDEQQEPGGEGTSGARQYRYCLCAAAQFSCAEDANFRLSKRTAFLKVTQCTLDHNASSVLCA